MAKRTFRAHNGNYILHVALSHAREKEIRKKKAVENKIEANVEAFQFINRKRLTTRKYRDGKKYQRKIDQMK